VSAGNSARSTLSAVCGDRVRALQHVLCRAARAAPDRRFHALASCKAGSVRRGVSGTPQGGLCSAEHKDPNAQCWLMRSAGFPGLVVAGSAGERCA
jgi:hypothetical protein